MVGVKAQLDKERRATVALALPDAPAAGTAVSLARFDSALTPRAGRPLVLTFFNPDCPCSRGATPEVAALVCQFRGRADFVMVVEGRRFDDLRDSVTGDAYPGERYFDRGCHVARQVGVYSTPQAVVLSPDGRIAYRGKYSEPGLHQEPAATYVATVLQALLESKPVPALPLSSGTPVGCKIPGIDHGGRQ